MSAVYAKPSKVKILFQRYKRGAPPAVVDFVDFLHRPLLNPRLKFPYSGNGSGYQPFFIVGSGRSGNTLLRKLLMEKSKVVIPPEIPGLGSVIRRFSQVGCGEWGEIVDKVLMTFHQLADIDVKTYDSSGNSIVYNLANELNIDFEVLKAELRSVPSKEQSLNKMIASIYEAYSQRMFGEVMPWGDKTPWNVFHYPRIKKVFPQAKYIHMLRDGRDCVSSYVNSLGSLMNLDCRSAAHRWRSSVRSVVKIKEQNPDRFMEVRYEDLVLSPDSIASQVIEFLGFESISKGGVDQKMLGDVNASHHRNLLGSINAQSVGRWKSDLSDHEKNIVTKLILSELTSYGYEVS